MEINYQKNRLYEDLGQENGWKEYGEIVNKGNGINREIIKRYVDIKRYQKLKK